ncbi:glycoside hydrolase [Trametopsis cervina]|nr:glycoside hydrolase [Trametopsis cervina]
MSFYNEDPRLSQARTDSSYATASPRPGFLPPLAQSNLSIGQSIPSTPRDSTAGGYDGYAEREPLAAPGYGSAARLPTVPKEANEGSPFIGSQAYAAAPNAYATPDDSFLYEVRKPWYKRPLPLAGLAALVAVVVVAVVVPVVLTTHHSGSSSNTSASGSTSSSNNGGGNTGNSTTDGGKGQSALATWGGDGSTVTMDDGSTFVYKNSFGGFWVADPANPFNNSAKPNSWTPALSETWTWGVDRVNGVNLGGLFVLEPFISPALFQPYAGVRDEWHLSQTVASSGNLTDFLVQHYTTFVTEEDIAQIAGAGLNWIRLPIPFWAIEKWDDIGSDDAPNGPEISEPFLARVCWEHILKVIEWARKYGIRVNLDLHAIPGSQNGYNHSGRLGQINFLNGVMGYANAQRTLDYIRTLTEFISQPQYVDVVPMFSIMNEPLVDTIGQDQVTSFYLQAHAIIRSITGIGAGKGPIMTIHDGFRSLSSWVDRLSGSDRIALDNHPYFAFDGQPNTSPIDVPAVGGDGTMLGGVWPKQACGAWATNLNNSRTNFGITVAGEFSNAINDCGLFVRGVGNGPQYGGDCSVFNNVASWTPAMKEGFSNFILASMDALGDWFFWTWKIGNDSVTNTVQAPLWSYQLGLENGFIPTDPRQAHGMCGKFGALGSQFSGTFPVTATGGGAAGTILPSVVSQYGLFPPTSIAGVPAGQVTLIPSYTTGRAPVTLPPPSYTGVSKDVTLPNGWFDNQDGAQAVTIVSGCVYPDAWFAASSAVPVNACGATASAAGAIVPPPATPTPTPSPASNPAAPPVATASSSSVITSAALPASTTASVTSAPPVRAVRKQARH